MQATPEEIQRIAALLHGIDTAPPFELLDFGCGPGRDLKTFKALGHRATSLGGAPKLAAMARVNSGCKVIEQNLLELDLPRSHFDGVFANAVLFHVPGQVLPRVLKELHATLKPGGVLFSSNPRGDGQEGWLKPTATMQFGISGMKMVRINTCRRATKSVGSGRAE